MATKKFKAPAGMNPEDAKDWEKYGTFVHHDPGGGPAGVAYIDGKPIEPYKAPAKKKTVTKRKTTPKKKAK